LPDAQAALTSQIMDFDVFISHSSKDKTTADATCAALEAAGIRAWIAPRDVSPGTEYAAAIVDAIESCRLMVVIVSSNANASRQIHREIERAASRGVPILPMRIEAIVPTKSMAYFLGEIHWLDALSPPLTTHLERLVNTIRAILQVDADEPFDAIDAVMAPRANTEPPRQSIRKPNAPAAAGARLMPVLAGTTALVGVACFGVFLLWREQLARAPAAPAAAPPAPRPAFVIRRTEAFGGTGGAAFDDIEENPDHLPVTGIRIVENLNPADTKQRIIGGLQVRWGDKFGPMHGGKGPYAQPPQLVEFAPREKIGRVDVNWMTYRFPTSNNVPPQWVAGLVIGTDTRFYSFGDVSFGPSNQCLLGYGEVLLGFLGRSGSYIDALGCVTLAPQ
jgi:hypothetical protein